MMHASQNKWLGLMILSVLASPGRGQAPDQPAPPGPPEVLVTKAITREVTDYEDFTGRTEALETVTVKPRVTGYLTKINFKDGMEVTKGQELFEIDARLYQAALDQADAELKKSQARLQGLEQDYKRARAVKKTDAIHQEAVDQKKQALEEAKQVVKMAEAGRMIAQINLQSTKITAPISGRAGKSLLDVGNLVRADDTPLVTIVSQGPIRASFDIGERTLLRIRRMIREGKIKAYPDKPAPVLLGLSDEKEFPHQGKIDFVDNTANPTTGAVKVRGVFPNTDRILCPGLFVRIRLPIGLPHKVVLVSNLVSDREGHVILHVVNKDNKLEQRMAEAGLLHGELREIKKGLQDGEMVLIGGRKESWIGNEVKPKELEATSGK